MKATYRSKPFEAFQLARDMSNWKEALEFMGKTISDEWEETPEFLDVQSADGYFYEAYPTNWIVKNQDGSMFVTTDEDFKQRAEQV